MPSLAEPRRCDPLVLPCLPSLTALSLRGSRTLSDAGSMNPADSSTVVRVRDGKDAEWRDLVVFPYGEEGNMVDFSKDGKTCLVLSTLGRETTGLVRMDVATGKVRVRGRGRVQGG